MNKYQTLATNTITLAIGQFGSKLLVYFMLRNYTAWLGAEGFGDVNNIINASALLISVVTLSINEGVLRYTLDDTIKKKAHVLSIGINVAVIGILIFLSKDAKNFMDKLTKYLGSIMIVTVLYVAFRSKPPVVEAISSVGHLNEFPNLVFPIITLLGGSCGGYITFSGAHRLLDAGFSGTKDLPHVRRSVLMGVSVSGVMRILLFLAVLGVVTATPEVVGSEAWVASPPAAAFKAGAGIIGYKIFGLVILFAAITSIIGAAYTSVSFLKTLHPFIMENEKWFVIGFIAVSTVIMTLLGQPATLLVLAGSVNGLILPITLLVILLASRRKDIVGEDYKHPTVLIVLGVCVVLLTGYSGIKALPKILTIFG